VKTQVVKPRLTLNVAIGGVLLTAASLWWPPLAAWLIPASQAAEAGADCGEDCPPTPVCNTFRNTDPRCDFWDRPTLTGDWDGLRSYLQDHGVNFSGRMTHFAFGVAGGINQPTVPALGQGNAFKYTGRGEYDLLFDLDRLVGLSHGRLLVRAEH